MFYTVEPEQETTDHEPANRIHDEQENTNQHHGEPTNQIQSANAEPSNSMEGL